MSADHEAGEQAEGENYFVSMTDMMVGVLFIFIILLMTFALLFQNTTQKQEQKIVVATDVGKTLKQLQDEIEARLRELAKATELKSQMLDEIQTELQKLNINVTVDAQAGVLRFDDNAIHFDADDPKPAPNQGRKIATIAAVLAAVLPRYTACSANNENPSCRKDGEAAVETVFIEGHTDRTQGPVDNWTLSAERAANTYYALTQSSQTLTTLRNRSQTEILSISGYADTRPIDTRSSLDAYALNRRIDLRFVMDVDPKAGLSDISNLLDQMQQQITQLQAGAHEL